MPYLITPTFTGPLGLMRQLVKINGTPRSDVECLRTENMSGIAPGQALFKFPFTRYGAKPVEDNDLVEVWIEEYYNPAPIFRGHFVKPKSADHTGELFALAEDGRGHLGDDVFDENYNEPDEFDGTIPEEKTTYDILTDAYEQYKAHQEGNSNFENLEISLRGFPNVYAGRQNLAGTDHALGIQQVIEDVGGSAWRASLQHFRTFSQLQFFKIGGQGRPTTRTVRGTQPLISFANQPDGFATADRLRHILDARDVENRLRVSSRRRVIETLLELTEAWDQSIEAQVLATRDRYTVRKYGKIDNPNFLETAKNVGRVYNIPKIDDTWTDHNDKTAGRTRHPEIYSDLVQDDPRDSTQKQSKFLIFKFAGDSNWRWTDEGFTVFKDSQVHITSPIMRELTYVLTTGTTGLGLDVATASYRDPAKNFNDFLGDPSANDYYLLLGSSRIPFKIDAIVTTTTTGDTLELANGEDFLGANMSNAPTNYTILEIVTPLEHSGSAGAWDDANTYTPGGTLSAMTPGEHVGKLLVEGTTYESSTFPEFTYTTHMVIANDATTITVSPPEADFATRTSGVWKLINNVNSHFEVPDEIWLDFAYESERRMFYDTGRLGNSNQDRSFKLTEDSFRWESFDNNAVLSVVAGKITVTLPGTETDSIKEDTEMQEWAVRRIAATKDIIETFSVELPMMDLSAQVGNKYKDNFNLTGTNIVGIEHAGLTRGGRTKLHMASR